MQKRLLISVLGFALSFFGCSGTGGPKPDQTGAVQQNPGPQSDAELIQGIVKFRYETGTVKVTVELKPTEIVAKATLMDLDPKTGQRVNATELDTGVSITWPETLKIVGVGCFPPVLRNTTTQTTEKTFFYDYGTDSGAGATIDGSIAATASCHGPGTPVQATAEVTVNKESLPTKTVTGSGSSAGQAVDRVLFVSSLLFDGNLGGLAGADANCQQLGEAGSATASLPASPSGTNWTWKAVLSFNFSGMQENARDRFKLVGGEKVRTTTGLQIVANSSQLWNAANEGLFFSPRFDENGTMPSDPTIHAWTGSNSTGAYLAGGVNDCNGWTSNMSGVLGRSGNFMAFSGFWLDNTISWNCSALRHIYCMNVP